LRFFALKAKLGEDPFAKHYESIRTGLMVLTEGGTEEEIDDLAINLARVANRKVFILKPEAMKAVREVANAAAEAMGYNSLRIRHAKDSPSTVKHPILDCTYRSDYPALVSWKFLGETGAIIHVGRPYATVSLYPYIEAVVHEGNTVKLSRLSELVSYLGECNDPIQQIAGCSYCSQRACYERTPITSPLRGTAEGNVYSWLESQEGYLKPSEFDTPFTPRRVSRENLKESLCWQNVEEISNKRAEWAKKAARTREKVKTNCTRCIENLRTEWHFNSRKCNKIHTCEGPVTERMIREALEDFSKSKGLATKYSSYLAQANIRLAARGLQLSVGNSKRQMWHVAYVYDSRRARRDLLNHVELSSVKKNPGVSVDTSKVPPYLHVLLFKSRNQYLGYTSRVVRLKDLLLGLVDFSEEKIKSVVEKDKWEKVPKDIVLMQNAFNVMPSARYLTSMHSKWQEYTVPMPYYLGAYTLPTTAAQISRDSNLPGSPISVRVIPYRPHKQMGNGWYYSWLERSRYSYRKLTDLFDLTYTHKGNVSEAILGSA
tara:strand:+ start:2020 stop:3651 length:1632 start_codon:yes stop_codon:yes gene_type:complete